MKVYCPTGAAVVRTFIGNLLGPPRLVMEGGPEIIPSPDLSRYWFDGYDIAGIVVIRQAGYIQLDLSEQVNVLVLCGRKVVVFRRCFPYMKGWFEGVCAAPHDQSEWLMS